MGVWTGTVPSWQVGPIEAADLQTMSDILTALTSAQTTYSPTWASFGTQPVLGDGVLTGKYTQIGKFVAFSIDLRPGATTTYGTSQYTFTLPSAAAGKASVAAFVEDNSTGFRYAGVGYIDPAAPTIVSRIVFTNGTSGFSGGSPITLASGDIFNVSGIYEAA